tara:strand:- start:1295 stop:1852 length:558 start_codon:yes stop_codon:yes gene_type:complete
MKNLLKNIIIVPTIILATLTITIASINNSNSSRINFLIWKSPNITLGSWIIISYSTGALVISSLALLLVNNNNPLKRKVVYEQAINDDYKYDINQDYRNEIREEASNNLEMDDLNLSDIPERDINDPPPTIAIPYRIIKKGSLKDNDIQKRETVYTKTNVKKNGLNRDSNNLSNQEDWNNNEEDW